MQGNLEEAIDCLPLRSMYIIYLRGGAGKPHVNIISE